MQGYIGLLEDGTKYCINMNNFFESHVAVVSKTGQGKSYLVGVLIEELAKSRIPVLVIDTHGEYRSLILPNDDTRIELFDKFGVGPRSFASQVKIFSLNGKDDIKFSLSESKLSVEDIQNLYPGKLKDANKEHLHRIIFRLRNKKYRIKDIMKKVCRIKTSAKYSILGLLREVKSLNLFSPNYTKPTDLIKRGCVSIIDLKMLNKRMQITIVSAVLKMLFHARKSGKIPPFVLVVEEAHIYSPQQKNEMSSEILKDIAAEGRKFGLCLIVVTQRPSKINKDVLSQPSVQIYLKVTNPRDVQSIYDSIENVTSDLKERLKKLSKGECLISGVEEDKTIKIKIRVRHTKHGGKSQSFLQDGV